jgi:hypothetical protein
MDPKLKNAIVETVRRSGAFFAPESLGSGSLPHKLRQWYGIECPFGDITEAVKALVGERRIMVYEMNISGENGQPLLVLHEWKREIGEILYQKNKSRL